MLQTSRQRRTNRTSATAPVRVLRAFMASALLLVGFIGARTAQADDVPLLTAAGGEDLANAAAKTWASDSRLIYIENDEAVSKTGTAERWGYLYYSAERAAARAYSIRDGKIRTAENLDFDFEAPPLPTDWIDSAAALHAAENAGGQDFRTSGGKLRTMLLVRGLLQLEKADHATWAVVYDSPGAPSLWIVVDAESGKVMRSWRG